MFRALVMMETPPEVAAQAVAELQRFTVFQPVPLLLTVAEDGERPIEALRLREAVPP